MASYKLIPCYDIGTVLPGDLYVNNNTNPSYSLSLYPDGSILKLTLPSSLTTLGYDITTCVSVFYNEFFPAASNYDLGTIVSFLPSRCFDCMDIYGLVSCIDPQQVYTIATQNQDLQFFADYCAGSCNGCGVSVNLIIPGNPPTGLPPSGCYTLGQPGPEAYNVDLLNPTFILNCATAPCPACTSTCYQIEFCDGTPFIIVPSPTVLGYPTLVLNTIVEVTITINNPTGSIVFTGCVTITQLPDCNPIGNTYPIWDPVTIEFDDPPVTHELCEDCFPSPGYILRRCDDPDISFTASNDLSAVVGKVITGVKITNCNSTVGICSSIKEEQCWTVSYLDVPGEFNILYTTTLNNCDCCSGPCD